MAINSSRLATRIGHILASLNELNTYRGTTLAARVVTIEGDYPTVNPDLTDGLYPARDSAVASLDGWVSYLGGLLEDVIVAEVKNDKNLPNPSLRNCLIEWRRQMVVATDTLQASPVTLGSVTDVGTPTSNPQFVKTAKDGTGVVQDLIVPDSFLIEINQDDQRGASTYSELYTIVGKAAENQATDYGYATGNGVDTSKTLIDPAIDQLTTDADFNNWTVANTPDDWTIVATAAAGTNVFKALSDPRDSDGFSLRLLSTASGSIKLRQDITASLKPNTVYGVHFKQSPIANGSATAANVSVTVRLVNASGSVIADDAGTNNTLSGSAHSVVTVGSGWNHGYSSVFITPTTLPSTVYFEIVQAADAAGADDYIDHVCLVELEPLYTGGPYLDAFSGTLRAVEADAWTWAITLTTGTLSGYIVRGLDRFLDLKGLGVRLPTAASPSISDSLIV